ncbi:MAG TPA: ABC transporter permease [Candidatus Limnocylindria bacterium]|jgi:NitT/TauT family transport system permease protein
MAAVLHERRRRQRRDRLERLVTVTSPIALLAVWELVAALQLVDVRFFPRPSLVTTQLIGMAASGELWEHMSVTLLRILVGFTIGAAAGVAVGLVMGGSRWVRAILNPMMASIYPIPKIAIFPLILLVFGLGETSKYVTVAIAVFFLVLFPTITGVMGIPRIYIDAAENLGARGFQFYRRIALPGALPSIFTGLRVGLGVALIIIVGVEFVGATSGIGYLIWNSWQLFNINRMFAGLLVLAALGHLSSLFLEEVQKRMVPWRL